MFTLVTIYSCVTMTLKPSPKSEASVSVRFQEVLLFVRSVVSAALMAVNRTGLHEQYKNGMNIASQYILLVEHGIMAWAGSTPEVATPHPMTGMSLKLSSMV